jgi:hypothetical protein
MPTAVVQVHAAEVGLARHRDQLAHLARIEIAHRIAEPAALGRHALVGGEVAFGESEDHPLAPVFGGIAEQLIHQRPQALFFVEQRAVVVRGAAAIAARGLPADHPLVEHQDIDAGARQPPGRAEPRHPAADHHHLGAIRRHAQPSPPNGVTNSRSVPMSS